MKPKLILCLALVLSGGLFGCTTNYQQLRIADLPPPVADSARKPDLIDRLVEEFSSSHGIWLNGFPSPAIDLPMSATMDEVVSQALDQVDFHPGRVTKFRILTVRRVYIIDNPFVETKPDLYGENNYVAVLVDTNLGKMILVIRPARQGVWFWRIYKADEII
jgi:hypothetical protein